MNCPAARAHLPLLLYGDLNAEDTAALEAHLAACPSCRREQAALQQVRNLLHALPPATTAPEPSVDLSRLYRQAAVAQERRLRRWRRTALLLAGAAAAAVLLAIGLRLEIRVENQQVTLRWGKPEPVAEPTPSVPAPGTQPPAPARPERGDARAAAAVDERLRILSELVQLLANDLETRDQYHQEMLARFQAQLNDLQQRNAQWQNATEEDVNALYVAQFGQLKKGRSP